MPELPDVQVYVERLDALTTGAVLRRVHLPSPFVLRSVEPRISALEGLRPRGARRLGKRLVWSFEEELYLVIHLMVAGRLRWKPPEQKLHGRNGLASFTFDDGALHLTEAGTKRRASLHVVSGEAAVNALDPGGLEIAGTPLPDLQARLRSESHTLKRALTDPRLFSGIGGAYADEILHRARLSPVMLTGKLDAEQTKRLFRCCADVLAEWTQRIRSEVGDGFPDRVTAFRPGMAVHGRFGEPCPDCETPVQRIVYADNETNYCPRCQTGGRILKDRALSRLLKDDWPRTMEELEERRERT